jgi:hypothetical protein
MEGSGWLLGDPGGRHDLGRRPLIEVGERRPTCGGHLVFFADVSEAAGLDERHLHSGQLAILDGPGLPLFSEGHRARVLRRSLSVAWLGATGFWPPEERGSKRSRRGGTGGRRLIMEGLSGQAGRRGYPQ